LAGDLQNNGLSLSRGNANRDGSIVQERHLLLKEPTQRAVVAEAVSEHPVHKSALALSL
jgi:hypothetical protein